MRFACVGGDFFLAFSTSDGNPITTTSWTRADLSNRNEGHVAVWADDTGSLFVEKERMWTDDSIHRDDSCAVPSIIVAERHDSALVGEE